MLKMFPVDDGSGLQAGQLIIKTAVMHLHNIPDGGFCTIQL